MALQLACPCGAHVEADDEVFVARVRDHLAAEHPGREYTDEQIMFLATPA